ncbi:PP2D1 protein, partial [Crypturellus undulatus]|nr:PP2D1 protein [Crypturellus undulatus]
TVPSNVDPNGISIVCSICQQTIYLHHLFYHKKEHSALRCLGYSSPQTKTDNETLLARRQELISNLTKLPRYSESHRQKIDYSFEFLADKQTYSSCCDMNNINNSSTIKNVKNSLIKALSICQDKNATWQGNMEDRYIVLDNYGSRSDTCFLGLVDGYHGASAAEAVSAELPLLFLDQLAQTDSSYKKSTEEQKILDSFSTVITADYREKEKIFSDKQDNNKTRKPNTYKWIHKAYAKSFWRMDRLLQLGRNEVSKVRWSGCSVLTCLVERIHSEETDSTEETKRQSLEKHRHSPLARTSKGVAGLLHIANIGNIHAVLCKNGKAYRLSEEHSTSNTRERKRILQGGGKISSNEPDGLVEGHLRTTRGLGHHGDPVLKRSVIPVPRTVSAPIDDSCQFLILASNGLWEALDYHEVHALTLKTFTHYLRLCGGIQQDGTSLQKFLCLMSVSEEDLSDSKATNDQQDGTEILQSNTDTFLATSEGKLARNEPRFSRSSYLHMDSKPFSDKTSSYTGQQLVETVLTAGSKPTPRSGEGTRVYLARSDAHTAAEGRVPVARLYDEAAGYVSEHLVRAALAAGSRDNITVLIVLLNGCDKI